MRRSRIGSQVSASNLPRSSGGISRSLLTNGIATRSRRRSRAANTGPGGRSHPLPGRSLQRNIPRGGRPVFATNTSGAKVWEASYLPFGRVHTTIGTPINLRFPGQWFQSETGLHQNWMRDYDPTTGRYMQADPLGLIDGASVYGYARGNPGRYVDPTGEQGITIPLPRGPMVIPRIGPLGPLDLPPLIMPRDDGSAASDYVDHPIAREQHRKYKQYCGHPPPPSGSLCTDLINRANFLFQCAKMREDWDNEWMPGRHKKAISELRQGAQNELIKLGKSCVSCPVDEANMSPVPAGLH